MLVDDENEQATVIVPDDQLALAIGREGQNARLATRLTGWRIDIKSESEFAEEEAEIAFSGGEGDDAVGGRCAAILGSGRRCPEQRAAGIPLLRHSRASRARGARRGDRLTPHVPERTCVGCGRRAPANDLERLYLAADGSLRVGRGDGRGAWIHRLESCVVRARTGRSLTRTLRRHVTVPDDLWSHVRGLRAADTPMVESEVRCPRSA